MIGAFLAVPTSAQPARIIILRHGEKLGLYQLCPIGVRRSLALSRTYLGKGATTPLLDAEGPAAILAVTLHTLETAVPIATSWAMPVIMYAVVPPPGENTPDQEDPALNAATAAAARDVMTDRRWSGRTVVMVWEHRHIADQATEQRFAPQAVTLRQLLGLDHLPDVPSTWNDDTYDYFWIVEYGVPGSPVPTAFHAEKQVFPPPFQDLPQSDWNRPETLAVGAQCTH